MTREDLRRAEILTEEIRKNATAARVLREVLDEVKELDEAARKRKPVLTAFRMGNKKVWDTIGEMSHEEGAGIFVFGDSCVAPVDVPMDEELAEVMLNFLVGRIQKKEAELAQLGRTEP